MKAEISAMTQGERLIAVLRVRGPSGLSGKIEKTFSMLSLSRPNALALAPSSKTVLGMLNKLKPYIVWGEISKETLLILLETQGRTGKPSMLTQEMIEEIGCDSFKTLAERIHDNPKILKDLASGGVETVFRLHPSRKGFDRSTKALAGTGGQAGYIGARINQLISEMVQGG